MCRPKCAQDLPQDLQGQSCILHLAHILPCAMRRPVQVVPQDLQGQSYILRIAQVCVCTLDEAKYHLSETISCKRCIPTQRIVGANPPPLAFDDFRWSTNIACAIQYL